MFMKDVIPGTITSARFPLPNYGHLVSLVADFSGGTYPQAGIAMGLTVDVLDNKGNFATLNAIKAVARSKRDSFGWDGMFPLGDQDVILFEGILSSNASSNITIVIKAVVEYD